MIIEKIEYRQSIEIWFLMKIYRLLIVSKLFSVCINTYLGGLKVMFKFEQLMYRSDSRILCCFRTVPSNDSFNNDIYMYVTIKYCYPSFKMYC